MQGRNHPRQYQHDQGSFSPVELGKWIGKDRDLWLTEQIIRQMAEALEHRPAEEAPIITSWLASVEGPRALAAGHAVEMLRYLRKKRSALMPYDRKMIADDADRNARQRQLISERQRDGIDRVEDRQWLAEYAAEMRLVEALVARGDQSRAEKQAAAQAAQEVAE